VKNQKFEHFYQNQKIHHTRHPWKLSNGLHVPHVYPETGRDCLTQWDDVGFILNKRRVMVWFLHPRRVYMDQIESMAHEIAGEPPLRSNKGFMECPNKNFKKLGASRKKVVSYTCNPFSDEWSQHFEKVRAIEDDLMNQGIDFDVKASFHREPVVWALGVNLVAPFEVQTEVDLMPIATLVRKLVKGETSLDEVFPGYVYGRDQWLEEVEMRKKMCSIDSHAVNMS